MKVAWAIVIFYAVLLIACTKRPVNSISSMTVDIDMEMVEPQVFKDYLTIGKCTNCSPKQSQFILEAEQKTNETVNSTCFASFMLERKLIDTNGLDNQQVVESLVGKNTVTDIEMYWTLKRVLGYTLPNQPEGKYKIWVNSRYMMQWNRCDLASLLGHETSHKKGYGHSYRATPSRPYSVPYSINAAFDKCCVR